MRIDTQSIGLFACITVNGTIIKYNYVVGGDRKFWQI